MLKDKADDMAIESIIITPIASGLSNHIDLSLPQLLSFSNYQISIAPNKYMGLFYLQNLWTYE